MPWIILGSWLNDAHEAVLNEPTFQLRIKTNPLLITLLVSEIHHIPGTSQLIKYIVHHLDFMSIEELGSLSQATRKGPTRSPP